MADWICPTALSLNCVFQWYLALKESDALPKTVGSTKKILQFENFEVTSQVIRQKPVLGCKWAFPNDQYATKLASK